MVYKNWFQQDAITEDSLRETVNTGLNICHFLEIFHDT